MTTHDLNEKIKWIDLSQAGVYLDVRVLARRIANYSYWTFKKNYLKKI